MGNLYSLLGPPMRFTTLSVQSASQASPRGRLRFFSRVSNSSCMTICKLQNSVSYFWYCFMSYFLNCSAWKSAIYDREQVKKYDTELSHLHIKSNRVNALRDESEKKHARCTSLKSMETVSGELDLTAWLADQDRHAHSPT